jgi:beta-lactamase regulating signal transducer with metallopeptidase domain
MRPEQFVETAASLSVQALLLVGVTFALCSVARTAVARCRLWTGCYLLLLMLALAGGLLPHWRPALLATHFDLPSLMSLGRSQVRLGNVLFIVWAIGALASLLLLFVALIANTLRLRGCRRIGPQELAETGAADLGCPGGPEVRLFSGDAVASPCCWQNHVPTIILPTYVLGMDPTQRRFIIRHEVEHLLKGHSLQVVLGRLAIVLFWFHPAVWWAVRQASLMREFACDENCVRNRQEILDYLRALLVIAEGTNRAAGRSACLHFAWGRTAMSRRTQRLLWLAQQSELPAENRAGLDGWLPPALCVLALLIAALWLPANVLASPLSNWSPWPRWTAQTLHDAGITVRDHEVYDRRTRLQELQERQEGLQ